jgi:hypothetical protein
MQWALRSDHYSAAGAAGFAGIFESYALRVEATHLLDVGDDRTGEASVTALANGLLFR